MPQPPGDEPIFFDRSKMRKPAKSSSSTVLKILLAVFGGVFLICAGCGAWFGYNVYVGFQEAKNRALEGGGVRTASGEDAFRAANLRISARGDDGTVAWGNSDEAQKLAGKFSTDIQTMREIFFTKRKKKSVFSLSTGEFLTYCHLDDEACVFLVHVPDLRKFTEEAKTDLADLAWATAQDVVRTNLKGPPPQLAVGTRGVLLYDQVLIGFFQAEENSEEDGILTRESGSRSKESLYVFFEPGSDAETPETAETPVTGEMPGAGEPATKPAEDEEKPEAAPETSPPD